MSPGHTCPPLPPRCRLVVDLWPFTSRPSIAKQAAEVIDKKREGEETRVQRERKEVTYTLVDPTAASKLLHSLTKASYLDLFWSSSRSATPSPSCFVRQYLWRQNRA